MSNGRHFSPPTPAYRPRDPFSTVTPRLAEFVPSCETTKPPPSRPRPVRMDTNSPMSVPVPAALKAEMPPPVVVPMAPPPPRQAPPAQASAPTAQAVTPAPAPRPQPVEARHVPPARPRVEPVLPKAPPAPPPVVRTTELKSKEPLREALLREEPRPAAPRPEAKLDAKVDARPEAKADAKLKRPLVDFDDEAPKARPQKPAPVPAAPVAKAEAPAAKPPKAQKAPKDEAEAVAGEGEEIRICEWEKCGKKFVVKSGGRTVVRRFCSGTCRGRASEARNGKR